MYTYKGERLYSASDLVNYLGCAHSTTLDLINLDMPLPKAEDDEQAKLLQDKGHAHEAAFVKQLTDSGKGLVNIAQVGDALQLRIRATEQAMRDGVDVVYQAALRDGHLIGHADFLQRVERPSALGSYSYEVFDTKLSRTTRAKHIVQLGFYSDLLAKAQGAPPLMMHVVLGDGTQDAHRVAAYAHYLALATERFLTRVAEPAQETYPEPCAMCDLCRWRDLCQDHWLRDDHLSQVANITRTQIHKLESFGLTTMHALAALPEGAKVPKMAPETLHKLRSQAALQDKARQTGERQIERLPLEPGTARGFARMPKPDPGDLFFDMEGNPLEDGGLEYLFGLYYFEGGGPAFKPFWAHDRDQERLAFEAFMDFVTEHLRRHPNAHIYHYASYEETALKKLMSLHATREADVDNLLRHGKLVDLYKVVRESIRVSEPRYSIKNIEHFYMEGRTGDVTNAGASIVYYERWKETQDAQLLQDIQDYNEDDVRSTYELREWLLGLRPAGLEWFQSHDTADPAIASPPSELTLSEKRLQLYRQHLVEGLPADRSTWGPHERLCELTWQMLGFHSRTEKPVWWGMFSRQDMTDEELLEDGESLAMLTLDPERPPRADSRSTVYTYVFPEQESKLKSGDSAVVVHLGAEARELTVDDDTRRVTFRLTNKYGPLPDCIHLGPGKPISSGVLNEALYRFANSLLAADHRYAAIERLLLLEPPRIRDHSPQTPIVPDTAVGVEPIVQAIERLDASHIFVQGPPGAGKTYTASRVIVALMRHGYRVGVSSNSHKAINNLLKEVESVAVEQGFSFRGTKKSSAGQEASLFGGRYIIDEFDNSDIESAVGAGILQLVTGTAWLFARPSLDQRVDYLFVDEAGQVALANLVAMSTSARNIVLLGDQMQLSQPIQGVHPGRSGESSLDYLLGGMATIQPERGIFLATTWRMHPDVCRFISEAVYDGRLHPQAQNANQSVLLDRYAHRGLAPTGIRFLRVDHEGCSQRSEVEAQLIRELVENLLTQRYRDRRGLEHNMALADILVVAPYNMQVNRLTQMLPEGARVGTVDKFQGQEAEVVIVSMTTSSQEFLPRHMEFLFSKNRLNVAVSRARCLAVVIANPKLLEIDCSTPEQMALVNTMCWLSTSARN